jgi:hypothetical protein
MRWFQESAGLKWIGFRFLPAFALLNLAWEIAHLPLYTLWEISPTGYLAFVALHCTAGDVLIGALALAAALVALRAPALAFWRWPALAILTAVFGTAYTAYSEWVNTIVYGHWEYAEAMPTLAFGGFQLGLSPILQWIVLPPLAILAFRPRRSQALTESDAA